MRDYGKVFSRIWESNDFRALSEDGRTLVLYLLTCQHGTIAGVFRIPDGYAVEDLQWGSERVAEGFRNLEAKGFATRCEVTKWVRIHKYLEWNPPENPNQRKAVAKCLAQVPENCTWKGLLTEEKQAPTAPPQEAPVRPDDENPCATLSEPFLNQEQEQEYSVPKGTGQSPPASVDPPDPIFGDGLAYLLSTGDTERGARSFLGKMRQALGNDLVAAELLAEAQKRRVSDPKAWLRKAAQGRIGAKTQGGVAL